MTIEEALRGARAQIPLRDAEVILSFVLHKSRTFLVTWPQHVLTQDEQQYFNDLIYRAAQGEPIAYLIGHKEFWSLPLLVNSHVLIPRADTEILVETVLTQLPETSQHILELGTGSGAISLALASERPQWQITAVDISAVALEVARDNAVRLKIDNIIFLHSDWFSALAGKKFAAIISNPPYVQAHDPVLTTSLRYEPMLALQAGEEGMKCLCHIITHAAEYLLPEGYLFLEHGAMQKAEVAECMQECGWKGVHQCNDFAGLPRVTWGRI